MSEMGCLQVIHMLTSSVTHNFVGSYFFRFFSITLNKHMQAQLLLHISCILLLVLSTVCVWGYSIPIHPPHLGGNSGYVCTHFHIYTHTHAYTHPYTHAYTHVHTHVHTRARTHTRAHTHMRAHTHTTHTHTHTHTLLITLLITLL